ncbi:MAG: hypothetical protein ABIG11_02990, partial [bacterium]
SIGMTGIGVPPVAPANTGRIYYDSGANQFKFSENGSPYLPISFGSLWTLSGTSITYSQSGYVGIGGTLPPAAKLHIGGTGGVLLNSGNVGIGTASVPLAKLHVEGAGGVMLNAGNVGIGTTNPQRKVHIADTSTSYLSFTSNNTGSGGSDGTLTGVQSDNSYQLWNYENSYMRFGVNSSEKVRIAVTGNVGIGNTDPGSTLDINGTVTVRGETITLGTNAGSQAGITLYNQQVGANQGTYLRYWNNRLALYADNASWGGLSIEKPMGTGKIRFSPNGVSYINAGYNVGIGTDTPTAPLHLKYPSANNSGTTPVLRLDNPGGSQDVLTFAFNNTDTGALIRSDSSGNLTLAAPSGAPAGISLNIPESTVRMTLAPSGNVGIGTTNPVSTMTVAGTIGMTGMSAAPPAAPAGTGRMYYDTSSDQIKVSQNGGAYTNLMAGGPWTSSGNNIYNNNSGSVGVGTTVVGSTFTVVGGVSLSTSTTASPAIYVNAGTGAVGIGTSAPGAVPGTLNFGPSNNAQIYWDAGNNELVIKVN